MKPMSFCKQQKNDLLSACFRVILNRQPDAVAASAWCDDDEKEFDLAAILITILESEEFASKQVDFSFRFFGRNSLKFTNDQSQFGEIGMLLQAITNSAISNHIVVDVGANGRSGSNSYDLMRHFGWKGMLIEANPQRNPIIEREFVGLDYQLINYAISDYVGEAIFHLGVNDDVSSLNVANAESWGDIRGQLHVKVERLPPLLQNFGIPLDFGLLSIDAEGEDVRILNDTIVGGYRPAWVIIEASHDLTITSLDQLALHPEVLANYEIVDRTVANLVLRRMSAL